MNTITIDPKTEKYLASFDGHVAVLPSNIREEARDLLMEYPWPTSRTEAWKYTRLGKILNQEWKSPSADAVDPSTYVIPDFNAYKIVLVNGFLDVAHSDLDELSGSVELSRIEEHETSMDDRQRSDLFTLTNHLFCNGGVHLRIKGGERPERPIHIIHINTGSASHIQHRIRIEKGAEAHLVHSYHTTDELHSWTNVCLHLEIEANATLRCDQMQNSGDQGYLVSRVYMDQESDSQFSQHCITSDNQWVRNDLYAALNGTNIQCDLYGAYTPKKDRHVDNHTVVDHRFPHCESNELYKGIIYDKATGVFNGKVFVREDAQKTNAFQSNANILMSNDASMNSKPELEIYADDVKCSHGSTIGQFDEEAVFYLKARGIDDTTAREMLVNAFLEDVFEPMNNEALRNWFFEAMRGTKSQA